MKYFLALIAIIFMGFFMVFGCSTESGRSIGAGRNRIDGGAGTAQSGRSRGGVVNLNCKFPAKCSGSQCCERGAKCEDICNDWFSGKAENECEQLNIDTIEDIDNLLEILKDAKEDELNGISREQVDLLCQVLGGLDHKAWLKEIKNYSASKAERVLAWMIGNEGATALLGTIDTDDAVEILEYLLVRGSSTQSSINPDALLDGLDKAIGDDDDKVLVFAEDSNNKVFINFIHEEIITKDICKSAVLPACVNHSGSTKCATTSVDKSVRQAACELGVYCKVIPDNEENVRKSIADLVGKSTDIKNFIRDLVTENEGINVETAASAYNRLNENDAEEWTNRACQNLKFFFQNHADLDLGFGD